MLVELISKNGLFLLCGTHCHYLETTYDFLCLLILPYGSHGVRKAPFIVFTIAMHMTHYY